MIFFVSGNLDGCEDMNENNLNVPITHFACLSSLTDCKYFYTIYLELNYCIRVITSAICPDSRNNTKDVKNRTC